MMGNDVMINSYIIIKLMAITIKQIVVIIALMGLVICPYE